MKLIKSGWDGKREISCHEISENLKINGKEREETKFKSDFSSIFTSKTKTNPIKFCLNTHQIGKQREIRTVCGKFDATK